MKAREDCRFGLPSVNKKKEFGNANYLWISYFYSYLNERGRAGFVMASSATDSQSKDKNIRENLIKTGCVDVMISVGNNFFYTKSLPCSLWFFDKAKNEAIRDKVLFIDARNYYTVVDRTLNEWSEWQLKNLNAIVWLYRGEVEKYKELINYYYKSIHHFLSDLREAYSEMISDDDLFQKTQKAAYEFLNYVSTISNLTDCFSAREYIDSYYNAWKQDIEKAMTTDNPWSHYLQSKILKKKGYNSKKSFQKQLLEELEKGKERVYQNLNSIDEARWLYERFGEGEYRDVPGLCKVADIAEIESKGWSLTPGAYVGVPPAEDDGVDFTERMKEIHQELLQLQAESNDLMKAISENLKEMGL